MLTFRPMRQSSIIAFVVALLLAPSVAWSMPNYARQPGVSCFSCHTQINVAEMEQATHSSKDAAGVTLKSLGGIKAGVSLHGSPSSQPAWNDVEKYRRDLVSQRVASYTDSKQSAAQGVSAYMAGDSFYASLSLLNARLNEIKDSLNFSSPSSQSLWFRFAYTPTVAGLNLAMSVFGESVAPKAASGAVADVERLSPLKTESIGLDAQVQGAIGGFMVNLKAMYMNSGSASGSLPLMGETRNLNSVTDGYGASARIGVKSFGLSAAYRTYKGLSGNTEAFENTASIGADLNIADRVTLKSQYTSYGVSLDGPPLDGAFSLWLISGF